jgi:hypothetical protein
MAREGNILSHVLRDAWDKPNLRTLTRHDPMIATGAYLSLLGHITRDDLVHRMTRALAGDGLGNRILWAAVKRAEHLLPFGGDLWPAGLDAAAHDLAAMIQQARQVGELGMDDEARELFTCAYPLLSADRPGLFGKLTGRAEAQTRQLACLYALLDGAPAVRVAHLQAALAVWEYCEASVAAVFGSARSGRANTIIKALRERRASGMTRTEIYELFQRNEKSADIAEDLASLAESRQAYMRLEPASAPAKRPTERWFANPKAPMQTATRYSLNAVISIREEAS